MNSRSKGSIAEERGCEYLRSRGVRIIDRNVYNRYGEIDIIALYDGVLHFVEVKSALAYEQAINNITPAKLSKLTRAIHSYLQQKKLDLPYCIDALVVSDEGIEWVENITF